MVSKKIYKKALILLLKEFNKGIYNDVMEIEYLEVQFESLFGVSYSSILQNMSIKLTDDKEIKSITFNIKNMYYQEEYTTLLPENLKKNFFKKEYYKIYDVENLTTNDFNDFVDAINALNKFGTKKRKKYERKNVLVTLIVLIFVIFVIFVSIFGGGGVYYRGSNVYG